MPAAYPGTMNDLQLHCNTGALIMSTLTNEEYALKAKQGDADALMALWLQVKRFAIRRAQRWSGRGAADMDDLAQAAFLALVDSVARYDPESCAFLSVFDLRLRTIYRITAFGGRSKRYELDPINCAESLNAPVGGDEENDPYSDFIPDEYAEQAFDAVEQNEAREAVRTALNALDDLERQVIRLRYWNALTQAETAQALKISVAEAKKAEASALRRLRHPSVSFQLRDYM